MTSIGSQSSWTPDVIYGYTGSAAEKFAEDNGYIFESIGSVNNDPDPGDPNDPTDPGDPNDPTDPGDGGNGGGNGGNAGNGNNGGTTQTGSGGTTGARTQTSVSKNMGTAQVKSSTPKTGIAFDAKYVLCIGVFFAGTYLVISKKKKGADAN